MAKPIPKQTHTSITDYRRVERAIRYLEENVSRQPTLEALASELDISPFHLQRIFKRWAGISPKRFLQFLTVEHAKNLLDDSVSVLDTALDVGLSGPGRLHDHFVALEAVTPGEYKSRGQQVEIRYGLHPSPFGPMFLAETERGVCRLSFPDEGNLAVEVERLAASWTQASLEEDPVGTGDTATRIFDSDRSRSHLSLVVRGTNFQIAVWKALLAIPPGHLTTYSRIADAVGRPGAARAVAGAVGANPVAFLVPCHRVIRTAGALGGYRWGEARKRAIIAWESARQSA